VTAARAPGDFIRMHTKRLPPPLVPEIILHLAEESLPIWRSSEAELDAVGLPPPYWAFAWAGGQALARHVIDAPQIVRGRLILDLAAGSGLLAIAAMKAGARSALAADIDGFAAAAIRLNAAANRVRVAVTRADLLDAAPPKADVVLAGDVFYERDLALRAFSWLERCQRQGMAVLIGDPGRSYLPRERLERIAEYAVPVTRELEDAEIKRTAVWRIKPAALLAPADRGVGHFRSSRHSGKGPCG